MTMEDISLNIDTSTATSSQFKKQSFHPKRSFDNFDSEDDFSLAPTVKKKKVKKLKEFNIDPDDYELPKKTEVKSGPISSLFQNNPDVPEVPTRRLKPVSEQLFAPNSYEDFPGIHPFMKKNLSESMNITQVTTVQQLSIQPILNGEDVLVRSQTGSGKTLAYAIPIIQKLQEIRPKISRKDGIYAVIILPTRELALQTLEIFTKLCKSFTWIVPSWLTGGEKMKSEKARIRKGISILVATPGRLLDHCKHTETLKFGKVEHLILDEADRILDQGYERDIAEFLEILKKQKSQFQSVLLSATLTPAVQRLAGMTLVNPIHIDAADSSDILNATDSLVIPDSLKQHFIVTPPKLRLVALGSFILGKCQNADENKESKMLVFMATQDMADFHTELLSTVLGENIAFFKLHGSMSQSERTDVFKTFRSVKSGVLICTDVAARGLDLPLVDWIVQYTAPSSSTDYVHRVGRTARVGHEGSSILFLIPSEVKLVEELQNRRIRIEEIKIKDCLQNLLSVQMEGELSKLADGNIETAATALQMSFESAVLQQKILHTAACKGYTSWVRFYASYSKDLRHIFNFKQIHLGHFAKSFALRDAPTAISGIGKPKNKEEIRTKKIAMQKERSFKQKSNFSKKQMLSEFDSGLPQRKTNKPRKK